MTGEAFETLFLTCVRETGSAYVTARDELVANGEAVVPPLRAKEADDDWRSSLTAGILLGWITRRALFEQITFIVRERRESAWSRAAGSVRSPAAVAETLAGLGPEGVPRLIEILTRTCDDLTDDGLRIVLHGLGALRDRRAVPPLLELIEGPDDEALRTLILATLGELGDARAFDTARRLLTDGGQNPAVRGTAALCLGRLGDPRAAAPLMDAARNADDDAMLRGSAFRALGYLGEAPDEAVLANLLDDETDEEPALELVGALARLAGTTGTTGRAASGTPMLAADQTDSANPAARALARAADAHANPLVRRAARDAVPATASGARPGTASPRPEASGSKTNGDN